MPEGGEITLETGVSGRKVYLKITDMGIGMDEETRKRIFQPFFSTKGVESGRGLGMSAVYAIVMNHDAKIIVKHTALGEGTTMELTFPFGKCNATVSAGEENLVCHIPMRILWVDDEKEIREIGRMLLEKLGHFANSVSSGEEALNFLQKNEYDLVITDIGMPKMNGWQLAVAIKEIRPTMQVAIVSGWGSAILKEEQMKHGVDFVLGKPIAWKELNDLVGKVLQTKK